MADIESNPSNRIEVELRLGDYIATAVTLCAWETEQWWKDVVDLLYGRPGLVLRDRQHRRWR